MKAHQIHIFHKTLQKSIKVNRSLQNFYEYYKSSYKFLEKIISMNEESLILYGKSQQKLNREQVRRSDSTNETQKH